ncbi:MAG TPA: bifunctional indole-3-glycerol-phosphate synthase TrpC/phosphoribosylanthranilate isomerase TrpF [Pyrinomonadaceae bacterium]|jgi:indole-3-glycerol phosphate synthase/phosphoribosylanthranilate isomerase/anthranilate synthase/indole-3-glycerol phosphate synthase/phosphoribosylanthranilate isomerase
MDFLSEIIEVKRQRLAAAKARLPLERLRELARQFRAGRSHRLLEALRNRSRANIIAEFKRRSPSKGKINPQADAQTIATMYESGGAAAISVLTEEDYFDGSLIDLRRIRTATSLPLLRKDFIFDEYQIYESAASGADALLLIVAALDVQSLRKLRELAEDELGIDALVEVHTKDELDRAVNCGARLIGVNNRDLRTFEVSTATSTLLAQVAPHNAILVSESGLTLDEVRRLREIGYSGFLIGESLMRASDPARAVREFIGETEPLSPRSVFAKICGITNLEDAHAAIEAGADMLGFNFYPRSPRFIELSNAREIIEAVRSHRGAQHRPVTIVGVFVNESVDGVIRIANEAKLDGIQLHGDETIDFCSQLKEMSPQQFVIKAVGVNGPIDISSLSHFPVDAFMVDAYDRRLRGGTGRVADWAAGREAAQKLPRVFLAGGLSPENVAEAIAAVRPYAVDACSALEILPGKKDHTRIKEFVAAVRASKLHLETATS